MRLDDRPVPAEIVAEWKAMVDTLPESALARLAAAHAELSRGFRPGKLPPAEARNRAKSALEQGSPELVAAVLAALRARGPARELVAALSEAALQATATDWAAHLGRLPLLAALLLDERAPVRKLAFALLEQPPAPGEPADTRGRIREALGPLQTHLAALGGEHGAPAAGPAGSAADTPRGPDAPPPPARSPRSAQDRERVLEARRTRTELHRQRKAAQHAQAEAAAQQARGAELDRALAAARARVTELEDQDRQWQARLDSRVREAVQAQLDESLRPWLHEAQALDAAVQQLARGSPVDEALALLARQEENDRRYGLRSALEQERRRAADVLARLQAARGDALQPLPALAPMAGRLEAHIAELDRRLGDGDRPAAATRPGGDVAARLQAAVAAAATLEDLARIRAHLDGLAALALLDEGPLIDAYRRVDQACALVYDRSIRTPQGRRDAERDLARMPLHALRRAAAEGQPCTLVVDGHNLLFALPGLFRPHYDGGAPGERARRALAERLATAARRHPGVDIHVWFDGEHRHDSTVLPNLRLHYSGGQGLDRADDEIVAYLRHLQGAEPQRPRFLATADREEASRAREAGVAVGVLLPHEWALWVG